MSRAVTKLDELCLKVVERVRQTARTRSGAEENPRPIHGVLVRRKRDERLLVLSFAPPTLAAGRIFFPVLTFPFARLFPLKAMRCAHVEEITLLSTGAQALLALSRFLVPGGRGESGLGGPAGREHTCGILSVLAAETGRLKSDSALAVPVGMRTLDVAILPKSLC